MFAGLNVLSIVAAIGITVLFAGNNVLKMGQASTELPGCVSYVSGPLQCTGVNGACGQYTFYSTNTSNSYRNATNVIMLGASGSDWQCSQVKQCDEQEPFTYSLECTSVGQKYRK